MGKQVGITTTVPVEILLASGHRPVDLNNRFVTDPDPAALVREAEELGLARTLCAWIKGIYAWVLAHPEIDTIIAITNDDEVNILGSLLGKRYGGKQAMTLVNNMSFAPLLPSVGIDVVLNPRETTISSILQHVRRGRVRTVHSICDGAAEILEIEVGAGSSLLGRHLGSVQWPKGVVLGTIVRHGEVFTPQPGYTPQESDRMVLMATQHVIRDVEALFTGEGHF